MHFACIHSSSQLIKLLAKLNCKCASVKYVSSSMNELKLFTWSSSQIVADKEETRCIVVVVTFYFFEKLHDEQRIIVSG